ncbi:unnamed protein product [Cuscuta campestris]|uniref:Response regulatory domain-containing protein n=1 Tax=Cuscuta campestris TaxID=132261 RepID=A0A484KIY3_9ASTE|nr:unnamed protein product [Cuscuta campestris]
MSSCHSMSLVVKCLSKGAVDFLVKPIRKNELKNLWQHVWRRCQSSGGSGSETGAQTQDPEYSKSIEKFDKSNDADDNIRNDLIIVDTNDDDDDDGDVDDDDDDGNPESSSTKKDVEVDSSQATFLQNEVPKDFQKQSRTKGKNVVETDSNAGSKRIEEQINSEKIESQTVVSVGKNATMYESRNVAIEPSLKRLKESREASHYMFWRSEQSVFTRFGKNKFS